MRLLDGNALRDAILADIAAELAGVTDPPRLVVVQVGADPASAVYVRNKMRACRTTGVRSEHRHLPAAVDQAELAAVLDALSADPAVHGLLLQLPLPAHLDADDAMRHVDPEKDVDGFHPVNLGRLMAGLPGPRPCTPAGVLALLAKEGIAIRGREVVVVGRSLIVGKPLALLLLEKGGRGDATVTVCHSRTTDLAAHTRRADILVAAVGRPGAITAEMVKEGAVVVDVGINRIADPSSKRGYRLVGDVDFAAVAPRTSAITPVPGGVGAMTVAMLMSNTLDAWRRQSGRVEA
ncbi:MAG: bifunctional methylenetetrahydrofolate dehydrogenase/methenyltetrahydrofolate cyclohydrolase FolD [Candidatus Krumholzibacteriota bacterium]|nr:bifunctional methylenetetrahydrofolate dehydrogenase/methenyltetrahydrofolate cyclohydrolase FolD [Candidatus Krumholzibacteriota bacterium]